MSCVRVLVEECKPGTAESLTRKADETFVPRLRSIPGFISYEVVKVDDQCLLAMGFFETLEGAREMDRLGAEWRKQYGKDSIVSAKPYIGEIILDEGPAQMEEQPAVH